MFALFHSVASFITIIRFWKGLMQQNTIDAGYNQVKNEVKRRMITESLHKISCYSFMSFI